MQSENVSRIDAVHATDSLVDLYPLLNALRMTPGWNKLKPSLWPEPKTKFEPLHWQYAVAHAALDQAGQWIGTELAERRNFLLFNPVEDNEYDTVRSLVAAYQMIKPGEHARAHRHSPNAMRLIVDAEPGCYTVVDGVKLPMRTGDILLTPGNCWHSHSNEGIANAYWIDVLDVPLVHLLEPMFFSGRHECAPAVSDEPKSHPFYFPQEALASASCDLSANTGIARLVLDTQAHIRTMEICHLRMEAGARHDFGRNTANRIFAVVSGSGEAQVDDRKIDWSRGDVLAVPAWKLHSLSTEQGAVLVEISDAPVMRMLGLYRDTAYPEQ